MATSGSIEIPFAAEWSQLRRDGSALNERLRRLEAERGRVSEAVYERVRADYLQRQQDLDLRAADLSDRAGREVASLSEAVARQEAEVLPLRAELEELDLRERLGESLDPNSKRRAIAIRDRLTPLEEDLEALMDLRRRVQAIAEGRSSAAFSASFVSAALPQPAANDPWTVSPTAPPAPPAPPITLPQVPGAGLPRLVAIESTDGSDYYSLGELTIVGRSAECGLRLPVGTVSRRHAEIERTADGWLVRDLQSENGTWVNDQPTTVQQLSHGDRVQFGTVCLVFRLD